MLRTGIGSFQVLNLAPSASLCGCSGWMSDAMNS
jgi:hypothetical protein